MPINAKTPLAQGFSGLWLRGITVEHLIPILTFLDSLRISGVLIAL
jgi:hypothetical protein